MLKGVGVRRMLAASCVETITEETSMLKGVRERRM
jgi:hypothetical protein